jgi:hypothetical protein
LSKGADAWLEQKLVEVWRQALIKVAACRLTTVEVERYIAFQPGDHSYEAQFSRGSATDLEELWNEISLP